MLWLHEREPADDVLQLAESGESVVTRWTTLDCWEHDPKRVEQQTSPRIISGRIKDRAVGAHCRGVDDSAQDWEAQTPPPRKKRPHNAHRRVSEDSVVGARVEFLQACCAGKGFLERLL